MSRADGVIIAGAAETDQVGRLPGHSTLGLHVEAAVNAVRDAGLGLRDIDGIATVSSPGPAQVAHALGIVPRWIDGTGVGGTSSSSRRSTPFTSAPSAWLLLLRRFCVLRSRMQPMSRRNRVSMST